MLVYQKAFFRIFPPFRESLGIWFLIPLSSLDSARPLCYVDLLEVLALLEVWIVKSDFKVSYAALCVSIHTI